ncbi:FMN-binding negative transcriptional regulator [Rhodobacteraceae bacterium NNCM2]|nr:FMN-binding negative transcriptional regulator [Coraliihabitans acroporae]
MHPNPAFRKTEEETARAFAAERGFGIVTVAGPEGVMAAHVPFVLRGSRIEAHMVRSNPIARHLRDGPAEALLIVSGPDAYISPDWYGEEDKVPTWNYVAVDLRGTLSLAPEETLAGHLERLSAQFEGKLPKPPWTHHKMTPGVFEKMMRQILPVTMEVTGIDSTFKLNQNRTASARQGAAAMLATGTTPGMETAALARLMREAADD